MISNSTLTREDDVVAFEQLGADREPGDQFAVDGAARHGLEDIATSPEMFHAAPNHPDCGRVHRRRMDGSTRQTKGSTTTPGSIWTHNVAFQPGHYYQGRATKGALSPTGASDAQPNGHDGVRPTCPQSNQRKAKRDLTARNHQPVDTRRVHAVGSYGFANFGDDLFIHTVRDKHEQLWPGATVRTFAPSGAESLYSSVTPIGAGVRLGAATLGYMWADTIALCGGSILQNLAGVERLRFKARRWKRFEALGVSVGPFRNPDAATMVGEYLARMGRIVVRDTASARRMRAVRHDLIDPSIGGDLAALSRIVRPRPRDLTCITICPSAKAGVSTGTLIQQSAAAVRAIESHTSTKARIHLLALSANAHSNDLEMCWAMRHAFRTQEGLDAEVESYSRLGIEATCRIIAQSGMVWSQRLHGGIVAYLSDVPFLLVGHHAKCVDFGEDVGATRNILAPEGDWTESAIALQDGLLRPSLFADEYRRRASHAFGVTA